MRVRRRTDEIVRLANVEQINMVTNRWHWWSSFEQVEGGLGSRDIADKLDVPIQVGYLAVEKEEEQPQDDGQNDESLKKVLVPSERHFKMRPQQWPIAGPTVLSSGRLINLASN